MDIPILIDIIIIFSLALLVTYLCTRLKIPVIVGLLLTGTIAGPSGFSLVEARHEVEMLAEIGVIMLLFSIGLEFSMRRLLELRRSALIGGGIQAALTIALTAALIRIFHPSWTQAVFIGFLVALSSTAIVLKQLQTLRQVDAPHGRITLAILIFQDILIVPMLIITPFLAGMQHPSVAGMLFLLGKIIFLIAFIYAGAKWLIPWLFFRIARTRNHEIFLMSVVLMALSIAWFTSRLGLSLAIGAFLAGLMIAESEYSHEAISHIIPFRDIFMNFFFVSVGMLINLEVVQQYYYIILLCFIIVVLLKFLVAFGATIILRYPLKTALLVALALAQIGEFSFLMARSGLDYGLIEASAYQVFLTVSILSMLIAPFLIKGSTHFSQSDNRRPFSRKNQAQNAAHSGDAHELHQHLIIVGYGLTGRNLASAAKAAGIPYIIIDMNPETVREELKNGQPIFFGDAGYPAVLEKLGVARARVMAVAIPDVMATRRIVFLSKLENPDLYIIARTRFVSEVHPLTELAADEVIAEEFESAIAIFSRALKRFDLNNFTIDSFSTDVRAHGYEKMLRDRISFTDVADASSQNAHIQRFRIHTIHAGHNLADTGWRKRYHINILAIIRESKTIVNPKSAEVLMAGDELVVLGAAADLDEFRKALDKD